ncbi:Uncharacterised protein [uncultured archaeon]|nr:Uncharacterised protein [uncultured archaeon]
MTNEETFFTDFELKEDLVESYNENSDIKFDDLNVKKKIEAFPIGTLLEIEKKIGSSITILSVKEVNEKLLASAFK